MEFKVEIIGFNIGACLVAQDAGADRIELCDNPDEGGTTASFGFIKMARERLHIDLYPIIRPRGGDFFYSEEEFDIMKADVRLCKELGCNGVVIGALTNNGEVDKKRCSQLVDYAYPLGVTFHRAFDRTPQAMQALEDIIEIGCERILTSGQRPFAYDGAVLLKELIHQADDRIIIMPGSGVRSDNVAELAHITGATEFHSSARIKVRGKMGYNNPLMKEAMDQVSVDGNEVRNIITTLSSLAQRSPFNQ